MHLEQLEPIPASAAFVTWGAAACLGRAGSSSPRAGSRARFAGAQALVALDAHWHQLNGFGRQCPDARQHRHVHHVPPLPRSHCAVLCQLLLLEKGKGHSAGKPVKPPRASPPPAELAPNSAALQCGVGALWVTPPQALPRGSGLHQFPTACPHPRPTRRSRSLVPMLPQLRASAAGGAGSPLQPCVRGLWPQLLPLQLYLLARLCVSVDAMAEQGPGQRAVPCSLCAACDHIKHPTVFSCSHFQCVPLLCVCGGSRQLGAGSCSHGPGVPESQELAQRC